MVRLADSDSVNRGSNPRGASSFLPISSPRRSAPCASAPVQSIAAGHAPDLAARRVVAGSSSAGSPDSARLSAILGSSIGLERVELLARRGTARPWPRRRMSWLTASDRDLARRARRPARRASAFGDARRAPGRPQVDQHRLAAERGERDRLAVGSAKATRRAPPRPCGCGRRFVARPRRAGAARPRPGATSSAACRGDVVALLRARAIAYRSRRPARAARRHDDQPTRHDMSGSNSMWGGRFAEGPGRGDARDKRLDPLRQADVAAGHRRIEGACRDAGRAGHRLGRGRRGDRRRARPGRRRLCGERRARGSGARRHPHADRGAAGRRDRPGRGAAAHRAHRATTRSRPISGCGCATRSTRSLRGARRVAATRCSTRAEEHADERDAGLHPPADRRSR